MFFRNILVEKNRKYESGGRKSTYCDATDYQTTARHVKSGLNLLSMLLIYHKYIDQVGKASIRCFPVAFWVKKNRSGDLGGRKLTYYYATDFQPTAQQVKSGLNPFSLLLIDHKYIDQVGKQTRRYFSATFWSKKIGNVDLGDENRHTVMRPITNLPLNKLNWV